MWRRAEAGEGCSPVLRGFGARTQWERGPRPVSLVLVSW